VPASRQEETLGVDEVCGEVRQPSATANISSTVIMGADGASDEPQPQPQPHEQRNMRAWREQLTSIRTATEFNLHGE
jgi:hypothetical protein